MTLQVVFESGWESRIGGDISDLLDHLGAAIAEDARIACPVDTGQLRDSIDYEVSGHTVRVSANVGYAVYVEEGTRYMAAEPFLRPALYKKRNV